MIQERRTPLYTSLPFLGMSRSTLCDVTLVGLTRIQLSTLMPIFAENDISVKFAEDEEEPRLTTTTTTPRATCICEVTPQKKPRPTATADLDGGVRLQFGSDKRKRIMMDATDEDEDGWLESRNTTITTPKKLEILFDPTQGTTSKQ